MGKLWLEIYSTALNEDISEKDYLSITIAQRYKND